MMKNYKTSKHLEFNTKNTESADSAASGQLIVLKFYENICIMIDVSDFAW